MHSKLTLEGFELADKNEYGFRRVIGKMIFLRWFFMCHPI